MYISLVLILSVITPLTGLIKSEIIATLPPREAIATVSTFIYSTPNEIKTVFINCHPIHAKRYVKNKINKLALLHLLKISSPFFVEHALTQYVLYGIISLYGGDKRL